MLRQRADAPKGLLTIRPGMPDIRLTRYLPSDAAAAFVEHYWIVRWQIEPGQEIVSENLPYPSVHLTADCDGSGSSAQVTGVPTRKFAHRLRGDGHVLGIKLRPGAFYPFVRQPVRRFTDRRLPLRGMFGAAADDLERGVVRGGDDETFVRLAEAFLEPMLPEPDPTIDEVGRIVSWIEEHRQAKHVSIVAAQFGLAERTLQRLFSRYVGVSPKWVIQRYRLFEAADALAAGGVTVARLAADLGYFDQSHFVRDFKALVGQSPIGYAAKHAAG